MTAYGAIQGNVTDTLRHFYHEQVRNILDNPYLFVFYTFVVSFAISSSGLLQGIRNFFLLYFVISIIISLKLKNFFIGTFLTFLFTLQFVNPNKFYNIEIIRGGYFLEKAYADGYSITYFFHVATFLSIPTLIFLIKDYFGKRKEIPSRLKNLFIMILLFAIGFCFTAFYSSSRFSPFLMLSYTWLVQYCFMYLVAISFIYLMVIHPRFRKTLFTTLICICLIQVMMGMGQLFLQRGIGLPFEAENTGSFSTGLDENNAMFRIYGTFMFHNQLSLIMGIIYSFLLPFSIRRNSHRLVFISALALTIIVLTQSRSTMIGVFIFTLMIIRNEFSTISKIIKKIGTRKVIFYTLMGFALTSFGIIPRILLSVNTGYEGAGLSIRFRMITEGIEALALNPLFGYGIGTNEHVLQLLFPDGVMTVFPAAIHQAFIQFALEVGFIGVLFFFAPFLIILRKAFIQHKYDKYLDIFKYSFIGGLIIVTFYWLLLPHLGMVEFAYFGCILGFGGFWYYATGIPEEDYEKNRKSIKKI